MGPQAGIRPFSAKRTCARILAHHGSYLNLSSAHRALRAARTGHDNDQGGTDYGFDQAHHMIYAFLPDSHQALVFHDRG